MDESAIWGGKLHGNMKIARGKAECIPVNRHDLSPSGHYRAISKLTLCNFK